MGMLPEAISRNADFGPHLMRSHFVDGGAHVLGRDLDDGIGSALVAADKRLEMSRVDIQGTSEQDDLCRVGVTRQNHGSRALGVAQVLVAMGARDDNAVKRLDQPLRYPAVLVLGTPQSRDSADSVPGGITVDTGGGKKFLRIPIVVPKVKKGLGVETADHRIPRLMHETQIPMSIAHYAKHHGRKYMHLNVIGATGQEQRA